MTWTSIGSIPIGVNWAFSDTVEGEFFRITLSGNSIGDAYYLAQAAVNDDGKDLFDIRVVNNFGGRQVVHLAKPDYVSKRQIAVKQIPQAEPIESILRRVVSNLFLQPGQGNFFPVQRANWVAKIEVSDALSKQMDLSQVTTLLQPKFDTVSKQIDSLSQVIQHLGAVNSTSTPSQAATTPLTIFGEDLVGWYRADSVIMSNNLISQWSDQSGKNNHALQSDKTHQATLVNNGFNGKPVIRFNNNDVWFSLPNMLDPTWGQASMFVVYNLKDNTQHWDICSFGSASGYWGTSGVFNYCGYFAQFRNSRLEGQPANMTVPGQHFAEVISKTDSYLVFRDTLNLLTTTPSWGVTSTPFIGRESDNKRMNGDIAEIAIVKRAATDTERGAMQTYAKSFWNLTSW